jgi:hypothetical protein
LEPFNKTRVLKGVSWFIPALAMGIELLICVSLSTLSELLPQDDNVNTIKHKYRALVSLKKYNIFKLQ